jgi:hypothetical protein
VEGVAAGTKMRLVGYWRNVKVTAKWGEAHHSGAGRHPGHCVLPHTPGYISWKKLCKVSKPGLHPVPLPCRPSIVLIHARPQPFFYH